MLRPISQDWRVSVETLREAAGSRRLRYGVLAAALAYAAYAFLLFPTTTARVRIGMDLTVGGVTRTASNVVELRSRAGLGLAGLDGPAQPVIRGEAVTLKLGDSAMLVMLLNPADAATPADWPLRQIVAAAGGDAHGPIEDALGWLGRQSGRFTFETRTAMAGGETRAMHPDLIFLSDRRLFQSGSAGVQAWQKVAADAPDRVLGTEGARITLWAEPVSRFRPISRGDLASHLPWFNTFWLRHWLADPPPDGLRAASFRVD